MKTKAVLIFACVLAPFSAFAESEALTTLKSGPSVICKDHADRGVCERAINNLMGAVKNITYLNDTCEANKAIKEKMDSSLKEQCETAKEITDYISSLPMK
ncbi:hypothetical protein JAF85_004207 [Citrobacter werkmanii]|nr:hypothetical protein [Citrobacter werkmanii]